MSSSRLLGSDLKPSRDSLDSTRRPSSVVRPTRSTTTRPRANSGGKKSLTKLAPAVGGFVPRSSSNVFPVKNLRSAVAESLGLTEEEEEYYREAFRIFDKDSSGAIDPSELLQAMLSIGLSPTPDELRAMIARVDVDQTGTVEFDEFLRMIVLQSGSISNDGDVREAFRMMDLDRNGTIGVADLIGVMRELGEDVGEEEVREMIGVLGVGMEVGFADFARVLNSGT
ncbi:calmodulin-like 3 [Rhizophlyctis rosea]|nr:calmodulin-like 3 [Rhizophlyctis rosea]